MRTNRFHRATTAATLVALCASCAATQLPPISSAGQTFEPLKDERRLWERSREEEKKLREHVNVYEDPLLVDYLEDVAGRLNPPQMAANRFIDYRVTVIEDPTLNAFAYPHGSLFVHTGLLARMENEDQLATVLGHEMTHVENRHMLRFQRSARNKQIGLGIGAIAAAVIIAGEEGDAVQHGQYGKAARIGVLADVLVGLGLQLAVVAAINGYGRDLEHEADEGGFEKLAGAGYAVEEAPKVYQALMEEHGDSSKVEAFFFGSHPRLTARVDSARQWLAAHPDPSGGTGERPSPAEPVRFERRIRPVIRDDARLNIERGRLELAESQLARVSELMPDDPETHLLRAELLLERAESEKDTARQSELRSEARSALHEAIRLDPERSGPHREMGLLAYREEDFATACVEFRQYLELEPKAEDSSRIRDYVLELERERHCH